MRIGIDARFFGPESKGLGRYTQKLIEHLEEIDHENEYVIFISRESDALYVPKNPHFRKVVVDYPWYTLREQLFFPRQLYREKCDFVHFPHFNVPLLYWARFVVTIHDLILLRYPTRRASTHSAFVYHVKYFAYRWVIASAIRRAQKVIAVSAFTQKDLTEHYPHAHGKTVVTHEAPEVIAGDMPVSKLEVERLEKMQKPYALYVGNAYPHKNVEMLVHAFHAWRVEANSDVTLVIVGRRDYFYRRLEKEIKTSGINGVVILDTVSNSYLHLLYQNAHAFLFPSLYEGFGLPPLEACSYGVPTLSSRLSCMPEILGDAVLYADVTSKESLMQGIDRIVNDQELREELKKKGPEQAEKYSWHAMAHQTWQLYKTFL